MESSRWFTVGQADRSAPQPGARAAEQAMIGPDGTLLLIFCSEPHAGEADGLYYSMGYCGHGRWRPTWAGAWPT